MPRLAQVKSNPLSVLEQLLWIRALHVLMWSGDICMLDSTKVLI